MTAALTIGQLARAAAVNVETIRYYQRRGLLDKPDKPPGGHRRYPSEVAKRVRFIKRAQGLDFTLEEIMGLVKLDEAHACTETRDLAAHKLQTIDSKLADLTGMRKALANLIWECDSAGVTGACPIIHALATD